MKYWFLYNLSDGSIYGAPYLGNAEEWTNIPSGCAVLDAIDATTASAMIIDAFTNPTHYTVQNNTFVAVANIAELQLANTQNSKLSQIVTGYNQALTKGFSSSASGNSLNYDYSADSQALFTKLTIGVVANLIPYPYPINDINGNTFSYTQIQIQQLLKDLTAFETKLQTEKVGFEAQVRACTTVDAVDAIVISFS